VRVYRTVEEREIALGIISNNIVVIVRVYRTVEEREIALGIISNNIN